MYSLKSHTSFAVYVCLSVRPYVHMYQLGSHWTDFREIWYCMILRKSVKKKPNSVKTWQKYRALNIKIYVFSYCWQRHMYGKNTQDILLRFHGKVFKIYYIADSDICTVRIHRTYCCVSIAKFSKFITLLTGTLCSSTIHKRIRCCASMVTMAIRRRSGVALHVHCWSR